MQRLHDAGTILFCYNLERPERPFEGNVRMNSFKVYMADTGLFVSMFEDGTQKDIINGDVSLGFRILQRLRFDSKTVGYY